jgi:hypothetical protein
MRVLAGSAGAALIALMPAELFVTFMLSRRLVAARPPGPPWERDHD